ncbi:probable disease resistance protein At4g27220 [Aristolochia californica]|uniref:probable disease resistance protein At4g27220 n=1 Tax=Aristolochia californica TaxID=171875 RepID=UPI0035D96FCD
MDQVKKVKSDRYELGVSLTYDAPPLDVVEIRGNNIVRNEVGGTLMEHVMKASEDDNTRSIGIHGLGELKTIQDHIVERLGMKLENSEINLRAHKLFEGLNEQKSKPIILDDVWTKLKVASFEFSVAGAFPYLLVLFATEPKELLDHFLQCKSVAKKMDRVTKLKNYRNDLGVSLTYHAPPPDVVEIREDNIVRNEVGATIMEQVMKALEDDNVRSIGIHGMGGIGKTTLVRNINNCMKESTLFNKVIMVTVETSCAKTSRRIKFENKDINLRAHQLLKGLNEQKSILIILDDVWTELKVVQLGIPRKNEHGCCKIILTSRNRSEQYVWQGVVRRLRSSEPTELDGIMSDVFSTIKISYDFLGDKGMKFCFLFCSLFPEDDNINMWDLRFFGIGEGFLHVEGYLLQAQVKLRAYIRSLKDCGLLLDGNQKDNVKMHDLGRDTTHSIVSKEGHGFIEKTRKNVEHLQLEWRPDLKNVLQLDTITTLKQLGISNCSVIQYIANTEEAPLSKYALGRLEVLRLLELSTLEKICQGPLPERFVMNPDHLQALQSLEKLYLKNCDAMTHVTSTIEEPNRFERHALEHLVELTLEDMPNLKRICDGPVPEGFLKKLKRLSLIRCGKLINIFSRDLVHCIETIDVIELEGIYAMDKIFGFSSLTLPNPLERLESLSLKEIETLTMVFDGPWPTRRFPNLEFFAIETCPELVSIWSFDNNAPLESCHEVGDLCQLSNVVINSNGPKHVGSFNRLCCLCIARCGKLQSILSLLLAPSLLHLETLDIRHCEGLKELISNDELMTMHHSSTPKLALKAVVFPNLVDIVIFGCHNSKKLFSFSMVRHGLQNLHHIFLSNCGQLKEIIAKEDEEKEEVIPLEDLFPQFDILKIKVTTASQYTQKTDLLGTESYHLQEWTEPL